MKSQQLLRFMCFDTHLGSNNRMVFYIFSYWFYLHHLSNILSFLKLYFLHFFNTAFLNFLSSLSLLVFRHASAWFQFYKHNRSPFLYFLPFFAWNMTLLTVFLYAHNILRSWSIVFLQRYGFLWWWRWWRIWTSTWGLDANLRFVRVDEFGRVLFLNFI